MTDLAAFLAASQQRIASVLQARLQQQAFPFAGQQQPALDRLREAQQYSIGNGGKRLRPALVYASACSLPAPPADTDLDLLAAAIECIHGYSLIHDDLPAMDDDALRRGQPTCHIAYDEATAILAGDGLQALAFELLADLAVAPAAALRAIRYLAQAAGNHGMVGGQMIDLQAVASRPALVDLETMHRLKTGALIQAAVLLPAIAVAADDGHCRALGDYAAAIGLAFQVQDDILDIESDTATLGKTQGADARLNKPTYPALLGMAGARQKAADLVQQAHDALAPLPGDCRLLHALADYITARRF
ncbi:MAG TPA: farnesyl diphosphate synthase [Pseudomonadales bacterium]